MENTVLELTNMHASDHPDAEKQLITQRDSWDTYWLKIANTVSSRATCTRRKVGAVLVRDKLIVSTGYNGAVHGAPHCLDKGCIIEDGHCVATVHAETNAILQAASNGINTSFTVMYVTSNPCINCYKLIVNAGIKRVVYSSLYREVDYGKLGISPNVAPSLIYKPI